MRVDAATRRKHQNSICWLAGCRELTEHNREGVPTPLLLTGLGGMFGDGLELWLQRQEREVAREVQQDWMAAAVMLLCNEGCRDEACAGLLTGGCGM